MTMTSMDYEYEDVSAIPLFCQRDKSIIDENICFQRIIETSDDNDLRVCGHKCTWGMFLKERSPFNKEPRRRQEDIEKEKNNRIGRLVTKARRQCGLSFFVLSCILGVKESELMEWESGKMIPEEKLCEMISVLDLDDTYFEE